MIAEDSTIDQLLKRVQIVRMHYRRVRCSFQDVPYTSFVCQILLVTETLTKLVE